MVSKHAWFTLIIPFKWRCECVLWFEQRRWSCVEYVESVLPKRSGPFGYLDPPFILHFTSIQLQPTARHSKLVKYTELRLDPEPCLQARPNPKVSLRCEHGQSYSSHTNWRNVSRFHSRIHRSENMARHSNFQTTPDPNNPNISHCYFQFPY